VPADWPDGVRHRGRRELGLGSCAERVNLSSRGRARLVERLWPAVVRGRECPKRLKP